METRPSGPRTAPGCQDVRFPETGCGRHFRPPPTPQLHAPLLRHWCWYRRQIGLQLRLTVGGGPSPCSGQATDRPRQQEGPVFQKTRVQTPGTVLQVATYYASRSDHPRWAKAEDEGGPPPPSSSAEGRADGAFAFLTQIFPGGSAPGPRPRDLGRGQRPLFSAALGCRLPSPSPRTSFDSETP